MLDLAECGACSSVVLRVGAPRSLLRSALEVVLAPPARPRALFPGYTIQPLWDWLLLAFPAGTAPPGLFAAPDSFFAVVEAPQGELPDDGNGNSPRAEDHDWARSCCR